MNKMIAMIVFLILMISALPAAIAEEDDACTVHADCSEGEFCDEGECDEIECTDDSDCTEGEICSDHECEEDDDEDEEENDDADDENEQMDEATEEIADAEEEIAKAEDKIAEAETDGEEVSASLVLLERAIDYLDDAKLAFDAGDYIEAEDLADQAEDFAADARMKYLGKTLEELEEDEADEEDSDETGEELGDDDEDEDNEDAKIEEETEEFSSNLGAQVRLSVLKKKLSWAVSRGEIVVDHLENNNDSNSTEYIANLNNILDDLNSIIDEIDVMLKSDSELSVDDYVSLRKDAWSLVRDFKKIVWANTTPEQRQDLKKLLREADYSFLDKLKDETKNLIRRHNANKIAEISELLGKDNSDLVNDIKEGIVNAKEARDLIREEYKAATDRAKEQFRDRVEEAKRTFEEERQRAVDRLRGELREARDRRTDARDEIRDGGERR